MISAITNHQPNNNKKIAITSALLVNAGSLWFAYGMGRKSVHVDYSLAYHEPTQRLFSHFAEILEKNKIEVLKREVELFNTKLSKIRWYDNVSYSALVNEVTNTTPKLPERK